MGTRLKDRLPGGKGKVGRPSDSASTWRFLNGLLWLARTGAPWEDLPERYGKWQSVKRRYYRWVEQGVFDVLFAQFASDADMEWLMLDSTIIRAHQHAAGARHKKGGNRHRA